MNNFLLENTTYQVYPISFKDSNDDGIGDINGIISKLDYLNDLGIKNIWLSPIYASPMFDFGYDISDYYSINPKFGTMDDFDKLLRECKNRGMKVIMDLVVNHTSIEHPWFKKAIEDKQSKYRDYYIFKEGKGKDNKLPPNNWQSSFLGSAWSEVENEKGMYYLHLFTNKQPDLNWHNEEVIKEVINIMNFYLDKGVFGFRCDVISCIYKESLEDGYKRKLGDPIGQEHYISTLGCHNILKRLRKEAIDPHNGVLIGELYGVKSKDIKPFLDNELDTFFSFDHVTINQNKIRSEYVSPKKFKNQLIKWQLSNDSNGIYLENHDQRRSINKYIKEGYEDVGSKMLLTLIHTLKGYPFIYQGEEIGSKNYPNKEFKIEDSNDIVTKQIYSLARSFHMPKHLCEKLARHNGRDDSRAPMAFSSSKGYGFTSEGIKPWQKFNSLNSIINVESQIKDDKSTLNFTKKILQFRKDNKVLSYGDISFIDTQDKVLAFYRNFENDKVLVLINLNYRIEKINKELKKYINKENILLNNLSSINQEYLFPYQAIIIKF